MRAGAGTGLALAPRGKAKKMLGGKRGSRRCAIAAFTILELLTVIVVIGILVGLSTAVVLRTRMKARVAAAVADLEALARGVRQFRDDLGFCPPSRLSDWKRYQDASPTPVPIASPLSMQGNFIDFNRNGIADAVVPTPDPSSPPAHYEENGIELLLLFLSTKKKGGPYFSSRELRNRDDDALPGRIFSSDFYDPDSKTTALPELYDPFDSPYVYISSEFYVSGISVSVDTNGDGNSEVDGEPAAGRTLRPAKLDPRTNAFLRRESYQLYSMGPNRTDNLGFGGAESRDGVDNDLNGIVDDEDDISAIH